MKRLIRKSGLEESFLQVNELDEADIRMDKCPLCRGQQSLVKEDGFKFCPSCKSKYKIFDGNAYVVH